MGKFAFMLAVFVAGCTVEAAPSKGAGNQTGADGGATTASAGVCAQRSGSYVQKRTVRSGDCGDSAENVVNVDKQPTTVDPPCTGSISYSDDNCEVTYTTNCPVDTLGKGVRAVTSGKSKWSDDASRGTGIEEWTFLNPSGVALCHGTYDLVATRQ